MQLLLVGISRFRIPAIEQFVGIENGTLIPLFVAKCVVAFCGKTRGVSYGNGMRFVPKRNAFCIKMEGVLYQNAFRFTATQVSYCRFVDLLLTEVGARATGSSASYCRFVPDELTARGPTSPGRGFEALPRGLSNRSLVIKIGQKFWFFSRFFVTLRPKVANFFTSFKETSPSRQKKE